MNWGIGWMHIVITPAEECNMKQYVAWIYVDRLVVSLRLLVVKVHTLCKHCGCYALRIVLIFCTNILVIYTENYIAILHEVLTSCIENYTDILHVYYGCLHREIYWYPARILWLFAPRNILISCTNIVAVYTEKYTDILHEYCGCFHENYTNIMQKHCGCWHWELYCYPARNLGLFDWELYWHPARVLWLFALRIILLSCTNFVAVWPENYTDILHEYYGCLHWELYCYPARTLWLFDLRLILTSCTSIMAFALRIILISCTSVVAVCTENYTDILHKECM